MHYNKASNIYKKTENDDITNGDTITVVKKVVTDLIAILIYYPFLKFDIFHH